MFRICFSKNNYAGIELSYLFQSTTNRFITAKNYVDLKFIPLSPVTKRNIRIFQKRYSTRKCVDKILSHSFLFFINRHFLMALEIIF